MWKDKLRDDLTKLAHSFNCTLGQMIFTTAGMLMLFGSALPSPGLYITTMVVACTLVWMFRHNLKD